MWNRFDILRKLPDGGIVWIEAAKDLEAARERIKLFATHKPGEYVIFSQETQSVIELPWVTYTPQNAEAISCRRPTKRKTRDKVPDEFAAKWNAKQVIRKIVDDIGRVVAGEE
jgi:hypothetical protein